MISEQTLSIVVTYSKEELDSTGMTEVRLNFNPNKGVSDSSAHFIYPTIMGIVLKAPYKEQDMLGGSLNNSNRVFLFKEQGTMLDHIHRNLFVWLVMRARDVEHLEGLPEGDPYLGIIVEQRLLRNTQHYKGAPYCTNLQGDPPAWRKKSLMVLRGTSSGEVIPSSKEVHGLEGALFPTDQYMHLQVGVKPAVSCDSVYLVSQDGVYGDSSVLAHCPHAALHFAGGCHPGCNLCGEHVVLGINIRDQYTKEKEG